MRDYGFRDSSASQSPASSLPQFDDEERARWVCFPQRILSAQISLSGLQPSFYPLQLYFRYNKDSLIEHSPQVPLPPLDDDSEESTSVLDRPGVWNADTRLYLLHKWRTHLNTYRHHVWPLSPVNPDALHVSCLDYLLCTPEGREERSNAG